MKQVYQLIELHRWLQLQFKEELGELKKKQIDILGDMLLNLVVASVCDQHILMIIIQMPWKKLTWATQKVFKVEEESKALLIGHSRESIIRVHPLQVRNQLSVWAFIWLIQSLDLHTLLTRLDTATPLFSTNPYGSGSYRVYYIPPFNTSSRSVCVCVCVCVCIVQ